MEIEATFGPDGMVKVKAVDLVGDAWHDYLHFLAEARKAESVGDLRATNRALRAALGNLFAHLDGVIGGLYGHMRETSADFEPSRRRGRDASLKDRVSRLKQYAVRRRRSPLPYLSLRLKPLRDILAHPNITKRALGGDDVLSAVDLFELTPTALDEEGNRIADWLDKHKAQLPRC